MWNVFYCWILLSRNSAGSILRLIPIHPFLEFSLKSYYLPFWDAAGNVAKFLPSWSLYSRKETDHKHLTTQIYSTTWEGGSWDHGGIRSKAMENNRQGSSETDQGCLGQVTFEQKAKMKEHSGQKKQQLEGPRGRPMLGEPREHQGDPRGKMPLLG